MLTLLAPVLVMQCMSLDELSGTFDTALSAGVETCWTLTCVGRLELAYNPSFEGKFVVNNGTETALRTDAHYNTVTFNAYWDVTLTAAVDVCAGGNCSSSVEFSWGCGMDAPALEVAAVSTADTSSQASAIVTPDFVYSYFHTPLVHTISCVGTLEMNYRLFYVGNFSVNSAAAQVFYTTAYGPHFGTSRFTADGDVSFLAQGRTCYRGGCGGFQYSWGCNMPAPELENTTPVPFNFTPSCPTTTTLGTSGSISTEVDGTECWELACEGGSVGITFTEIHVTAHATAGVRRYVNVYEMDGDRVVGFPFHETGEKQGVSLTSAASSVLVQYRSSWGRVENNFLSFDYICMGGATAGPTALPLGPSATPTPTTSAPTVAPPTASPHTRAPVVNYPTVAPPTASPHTRAPGVSYVCEEHNDLGDNETGTVIFLSDGTSQTACWHIECDKDVVISFTNLRLNTYATLDLYMSGKDSGNGTDFTLEKRFGYYDSPMDVVLSGSAFVQFRSNRYWEWSRFDFNYVCVEAATQAPPSDVPETRAPGVSYVCEEHNDLGDNESGTVSFYNSARPHTECWHIECDKDVLISFNTLTLGTYAHLDLYMSGKDSGNGTDFTLEKRFGQYDSPMDVVLSGSAFVQFRITSYWGWSRFDFHYVCVDATTQAPPTTSPHTRAPGVNDVTVAPPTASPDTRAPGVSYVCEEHNDLGDNETGTVRFLSDGTSQKACWHIECDKDVVISFNTLRLGTYAELDLYMSGKDAGNGTDFTSEKRFGYYDSPMDVVLSGSAFVQFRSNRYWERSRFDFNYVCVDATTQAPPTTSPHTRAPGVNDVTVAPTASPDTRAPGVSYDCEEHNDLGDNETGTVRFLSDGTSQKACWHIECDKDVLISFNTLRLGTYADLDLYMSGKDAGNGTDFTLEKRFGYYDSPMDVVLSGSAFVQFRSNRYWERSRFDFNYVCVDATTQAPPSDVPETRAPGVSYVCEYHNDLGDNETGTVSFYNSARPHTECWHIECDKDVLISFTNLTLGTYAHLDLYMSGKDSGNGTDFTLEKRFEINGSPMDVVLNGSAFVQFRITSYWGWSRFEFNYVCVDATAPVPPTASPPTPAPGVNDLTVAPPTTSPHTRAPGVSNDCEEYNDLGDNVTGRVSFHNDGTYQTACWHIKCDKDVLISFNTLQLGTYSYLDLLMSGKDFANGTDFTLEKRFGYDSPMDVVLSGSAFVKFRSTRYWEWSRFDFNYVCVDATTQAPPTAVPDTRAPGVNYVCEYHNDLGDNATGSMSFQNYGKPHTECWHIECAKDVVISFTTLQLPSYTYLYLYMSGKDSENGTDFTLEKRFGQYDSPMDVVLSGSAFVQFRSANHWEWSRFDFNYVCVDATTQAQPSDVPDTRTPFTDAPDTSVPMTTAPDTVAPLTPAPRTVAPDSEAPVSACAAHNGSPMTCVANRCGEGFSQPFCTYHAESRVCACPTSVPETKAPDTVAPTPETSTPSVPTTSAPLTVEDVDWCDVDADCRTYDDSAATCVESKCVCTESAGFVNPVTKKTKETLFICVQPTKRGNVKLRLEWNVDCEQSNGAIEGAVRTAIEETTKGRTDTLVVSCGSTIFVVDMEDADITTVATEDMSELIVTSLKKNEAAVAAGFATPMTVGSSLVPTLKCSAAGATEMVLVNGGCVVLACESGYLLSSGSCVEDDDSDDTLSTGAIVGIVLGCTAFVVIIIAVAAFFLCKGSKAKDAVCQPPHHTSTHCPQLSSQKPTEPAFENEGTVNEIV